ncbi:MAG: RepA protein [Brevinema sp.]
MEIKRNLKDFEMNRESPFAKQALVNIGNALLSRTVKTANKDESAVLKAIDGNGDILGNTAFIRTKTVDNETFAKVYKLGFKAFSDMKPSTLSVFEFITNCLKPNSDEFMFFIEDCIESTQYKKSSIYKSLGELCAKGIIARGRIEEQYYINPMYVFNGDRVTFATTYINKNYPDYKTTSGNLKGTIEVMKSQGELPKLPFE